MNNRAQKVNLEGIVYALPQAIKRFDRTWTMLLVRQILESFQSHRVTSASPQDIMNRKQIKTKQSKSKQTK